ncbi:caspase family protein [Hallerella succinigenes]|uniref:Caspase domain-containing protein n=1 Tax=Hallerella succinigenes TaxID=1896222 RepID=A0A2M9A487_9BACT|nr:caspase family protein [Hallerella succinigenes]PJJ40514.1 caspase domain-containing protein [Hallerella succinigenes]
MTRKAVVIGVDHSSGNPLNSCILDAQEISKLLSKNADGSDNFEITELHDATVNEALNAVQELFQSEADVALFYFSGHGGLYQSVGSLQMTDGPLMLKGLMESVLESNSQNRIVILDSCFSGDVGNILSNQSLLVPGVTFMSACKRNEVSKCVKGRCSLYTSCIVDALSGGAADLFGDVSLDSIHSYADKILSSGGQHPVFKTSANEFLSLRKAAPRISKDELKEALLLFPNVDSQFQLDPSFEETNVDGSQDRHLKPYAIDENVRIFKKLQRLQGFGLVIPNDADYMYWAAMKSKSCSLTPIGQAYWRIFSNN